MDLQTTSLDELWLIRHDRPPSSHEHYLEVIGTTKFEAAPFVDIAITVPFVVAEVLETTAEETAGLAEEGNVLVAMLVAWCLKRR